MTTQPAIELHFSAEVAEARASGKPIVALESTIREGDFKLVRNYDHVINVHTPELELFRLYVTEDGKQARGDIEEAKNLVDSMPDKAQELNQKLGEDAENLTKALPELSEALA